LALSWLRLSQRFALAAFGLSIGLFPALSRAGDALTTTVLATGTYQSRPYQILRLIKGTKEPSYALWFPPDTGSGIHAAVLFTQPYTGIDWTGDARDLYFAGLPNAGIETRHEDIYGPDYSPGVSGPVTYQFKTVSAVSSEAYPFLVNGVGVLFVFERFYAGGNFENDVEDTVAGFDFLATQTIVAPDQIGVMGGSLGGALAVHAAARAPADATPSWGVAWAPPVDMPSFYDYAERDIAVLIADPAKRTLWGRTFDPYLRRLRAAGEGGTNPTPDLSGFSFTFLKDRLRTRFLLLHDAWDTLVPLAQSRGLQNARPQTTDILFIPRPSPVDYRTFDLAHHPVPASWNAWYSFTLANVFLLKQLMPAHHPYTGLYHSVEFSSFVGYLRDQQSIGADVSALAPRLLDLCDERLSLLDFNDLAVPPRPGRAVVADLINRHWGTKVSPDKVGSFLRGSGLPDAAHTPQNPTAEPKAFPSPFRPGKDGALLRLVQLTPGTARLYGMSGRWVRDVDVDDYGTALWDGRDRNGDLVPSGVYILQSKTGKEKIKIAVLR
jgi:hypothetical protein